VEASREFNTEDAARATIEALIAQLDINPQTERVRSELFAIALQFQSPVASELSTSGVMSVDMLYEALRSAIRFDQNNIVEKLLQDARLDPHALHSNLGVTVLHEAAIHDAIKTIELLLSLGLNTIIKLTTDLEVLNALVKVGTRSARLINWAIEIAEEPLVDSLYSKGVDVTLKNRGSGLGSTWSALETACYHNCATATFRRLLERSQRLEGLNKVIL
jgi:ankyrin repeat protein